MDLRRYSLLPNFCARRIHELTWQLEQAQVIESSPPSKGRDQFMRSLLQPKMAPWAAKVV
jgi:hypothetical protein